MNVIYTMWAIDGIVEIGPKPATSNAARCALLDILEGAPQKSGWIASHTLVSNGEMDFPFKKPNPANLREFFGGEKDLNLIQAEIDDLFGWPDKQLAASKDTLRREFESASTKEALVTLLEKYHFQGPANRRGDDTSRLQEDIIRISEMFDAKELKEVRSRVESAYYSWRRNHVALLYNKCGDAIYYGAGYWMARIVPADYAAGKALGKFFDDKEMPHQVVICQ